MDTITADRIKSLLAHKHREDIYITECKMGSMGSRILDALVIKRTWSPRTVIGYEIKVSRQDFLGDDKWPEYLKTCTQFYFVCPSGLIQKSELPKEVGLIWVSKTGNKLYTKKKSPHQINTMDLDTLLYILMYRADIKTSSFGRRIQKSEKEFWEEW